MPEPLQARPGIGVLESAGREFEAEQNEKLFQAFQSAILCQPHQSGKIGKGDLGGFLSKITDTPSFILQASFSTTSFQLSMLGKLGVTQTDIQLIPDIGELIPDILLVNKPTQGDEQVCPDGSRMQIDHSHETRLGLTVIDIKHTSEANPSYSAEIALYAICLANWLEFMGLNATYYVSAKSYLWTRFKQGHSDFEKALSQTPLPTVDALVEALLADCEDANLRFYLPTVLHFFREDIPRVIKRGDASPNGWADCASPHPLDH
jgi:hypothetical protein